MFSGVFAVLARCAMRAGPRYSAVWSWHFGCRNSALHQLVSHLAHLGSSTWLALSWQLPRAFVLPSTQPWIGSSSHGRSHFTISTDAQVQLVLWQLQAALWCRLRSSTSSHHVLHLLHLLLLHLLHLLIHTLNLDEALHVSWTHALSLTIDPEALNAAKSSLANFAGHVHCLRRLLLLHITVFQVIEDAIEINCIQLHRHLRGRVLRIVYHRWRFLSIVHLACLNAVSFVYCDFLAVQDNQVGQLFDDVQPILGLSCHRIVHQGDFHKVYQFSEPVYLPEFSQSITTTVKRLESIKPFDVGKTS